MGAVTRIAPVSGHEAAISGTTTIATLATSPTSARNNDEGATIVRIFCVWLRGGDKGRTIIYPG